MIYQRACGPRRAGNPDNPISSSTLPKGYVASRVMSLSQVPQSSIIRPTVGGGVLVDPILLGVGHAFAPRNLAHGPGPVKRAAFRAVAKGFEPVLFL